MARADKNGRPYALLKDLVEGNVVQVDDGFTCIGKNKTRVVKHDGSWMTKGGLYIDCKCGKHFLNGQANFKGGPLIGVYLYAHSEETAA